MVRDTGNVCGVMVVGTDGTDSGDRAVEYALSFAEQYDSRLHVLSVVDTDRHGEPALSSRELVTVDAEERAREHLAEVEARAAERGVEVVTRCCHGAPDRELLSYADGVDADLTVLGYRGDLPNRRGIGRVTDRVVRASDRPLLLV
jgi:nucleotide-binding universal stress UspA family protein